MKLKINKSQFQLLTNNFVLVEGNGLRYDDTKLITESMKEFKVKVFFGGWPTEIRVGAHSPGSAFAIVKLMFPKSRVTSNIATA
jgi:hypothetical protein